MDLTTSKSWFYEVDQLLDKGFEDEVKEVVRACPDKRQTLLFSATMSSRVQLISKISLRNPVHVEVNDMYDLALTLTQEFVRIKKEELREATLLAVCTQVVGKGTLVFANMKEEVHRLRVLFGLLGLKAGELHGDLTQTERVEALQAFRDGTVDYLFASDLAARGLDISGVKTVLNANMPWSMEQYIHRVGRTARAGHFGRSISLVGDKER